MLTTDLSQNYYVTIGGLNRPCKYFYRKIILKLPQRYNKYN